jgi:3-oxoacyl-[acyl-carrier protein] reductase
MELLNIFLKDDSYKVDLHYNSYSKIKNNLKYNLIKADFSKPNYKSTLKKFTNNYDIIINLIGYIDNKSFNNFQPKDIEKSIMTNSIIPLLIIRSSLSNMVKKKWGRIVNSSSIGVKFGGGDTTFGYSIAKHLNEFIPKEIRKLASKNIFYNIMKIGLTDTKIHKRILSKNLKKRISLVPAKKMAKPEDVAKYIYYISSKQNKFITGEIIGVTGGE